MKRVVKRVWESAPVWAWIVMIVCVIILIVGLVISSNRTAPTTSANTANTTNATPSTEATGTPASVEFIDYAKSHPDEDRTIVLLGDSTGASTTGWAPALGRAISESLDRPMATAYWNTQTAKYGSPVSLGTGTNGPIGFWNGSASGRDAAYAADNLTALTTTPGGEAITPNLVLLNFGLTEDTDQPLAPQIQPLITAVQAKFPDAAIAVIKQNPPRDSDNSEQVSGFAAAMDAEGIQVIDVYSAFPADAKARAELMTDAVNPNADGQKLWTKTVLAAFGLQE